MREHWTGMGYGNVGLAVGQAVCLGTKGADSPCGSKEGQTHSPWMVVMRPQREIRLYQLNISTWTGA